MSKKLFVYDAETDELLGDPAPDLIEISNRSGGDGICAAWLVDGKWTHNILCAPGAREVYVAEKPDPLPPGWRDAPPLNP